MERCLLCLEIKKASVDAIVVDSSQWKNLNIRNILDKYLWPMNHIEAGSWICTTCWRELYEFHKFYIHIEEVHIDLGLFTKNVEEVQENDLKTEEGFLVGELRDSVVNVLETNPGIQLEKSVVDDLRDVLNENESTADNFQFDLLVNERKTLIRGGLHEELITNNEPLSQKRKRGRPRKNSCNGSNIATNKTKRHKKSTAEEIIEDENGLIVSTNTTSKFVQIKAEDINTENGEIVKENITSQVYSTVAVSQDTKLVSTAERSNFSTKTDSGSTTDTDREIDCVRSKRGIYSKCKRESYYNEKDKFLAENFKITCFLCNIPFETFFNMRKHFGEHHTERGHVKCCNKKFFRRSVLVDHVHYHLNPNYFKCNQCGRVMADRRCLELHVEIHETNHEKTHCCDICGKGFAKIGVLKKHRMIHLSEEEKRFSCSDCGKNFASNYLLSSHYRSVHLKKYAKICDICGKSIRCKDVFERHMLEHEGKPAPSVNCDICGLVLTDKKALKRHKDIIHPIGGQHEYTCSICSKTSPNLRAHKRHVEYKHVMGYDHKCTICGKAFKRAPTLKEHMASHTGTILYTCPWCPKTFNSNANMHNHRKRVHPKEWEEASRKRYSGNLPPNFKPPTITEPADFTVPLEI